MRRGSWGWADACRSDSEAAAKTGTAVLDACARGGGQEDFGPVEMLALLTARHRRASPPYLAEQPRMSLQTRRDYHAFLTAPIIRQALTVVVPEYDEAAPVLTKPVRPGLYGLAQGSLLQIFALTVGIGRIAQTPVDRAIAVLLKSDAEGQGRVQEALRSWPLSSRRRISARLWRTQRDEREREIAERAIERCQSHKYRRVQSHEPRPDFSRKGLSFMCFGQRTCCSGVLLMSARLPQSCPIRQAYWT